MTALTPADLKPIVLRSAKVALIVGPTLTLINQWTALTETARLDVTAMVLTFMVPFCVSFFSAYTMRKSVAAHMSATAQTIDDLRAQIAKCTERANAAERALHGLNDSPSAAR